MSGKKEDEKPTFTSITEYRDAVSEAMKKKYGITWDDACGDLEPLRGAMEINETPEEFVEWWGNKYGLDPLEDYML